MENYMTMRRMNWLLVLAACVAAGILGAAWPALGGQQATPSPAEATAEAGNFRVLNSALVFLMASMRF